MALCPSLPFCCCAHHLSHPFTQLPKYGPRDPHIRLRFFPASKIIHESHRDFNNTLLPHNTSYSTSLLSYPWWFPKIKQNKKTISLNLNGLFSFSNIFSFNIPQQEIPAAAKPLMHCSTTRSTHNSKSLGGFPHLSFSQSSSPLHTQRELQLSHQGWPHLLNSCPAFSPHTQTQTANLCLVCISILHCPKCSSFPSSFPTLS